MRKIRIGMRWWLSGVFVAIAIVTAALIASVASRQSARDLRANAESIAVGQTVNAGFAIERAAEGGTLGREIVSIGGQHGLALFVFSADGSMYASYGLRTVRWSDVPEGPRALAIALRDHRFVGSFNGGRATVVSLPLHRNGAAAAVVAYAPRPPAVRAANAIFRNEIVRASIWAVLVAAVTGLVAAWLLARRLRRIAVSTRAIEEGDFARELKPRFIDEVGQLAAAIDAMRLRLGDAFDQLSAERNRLEVLLARLQEGVIAVDRELRIEFANEQVESILGRSFLPGQPLPERYGELELSRIASSLFADDARPVEMRVRRGDTGIVSLVGIPAAASDLAVLVVADITARERMRQAEQDFVSNASHELRTPVAAIASAVEALLSGAQDEPASRARFIELIARQSARLTRLTSSLLTLARAQTRQEELQLEPVELRTLLQEVAAASESVDGRRIRVDAGEPVVAVGRRDILEQVVGNLVGNALKHAGEGEIVLRAVRSNGQAMIEVADAGPGIPSEEQRRIFERFYTVENGQRDGFGLGLAIARGSAEAIGGRLTIESAPGHGTTARVALPASTR